MKPILNLDSFKFGHSEHVHHCDPITCELHPGKLLWVHGPNGSGKSTFLKALLGKAKVHQGCCDHPHLNNIGYLPQMHQSTIPWPLTVGDVFTYQNQPPKQRFSSLTDTVDHHWNTASGGEQQRTLLARVLSQKPTLLLLDEPFNHLDTTGKSYFASAIQDYLDSGGAVVIVTHGGLPDSLSPYVADDIKMGIDHD